MVHLHNRYNLASGPNQPLWPLVAPSGTGMAVFFFYVAGHEDPSSPGARFQEAGLLGTFRAHPPTGRRLAADFPVEGFSNTFT